MCVCVCVCVGGGGGGVSLSKNMGVSLCCKGSLEDKDHDLELLDDCFSEASNLTEAEISTLYYISGCVTYKEDLETASGNLADLPPGSEFTNMLSRGKLKHPFSDLYDLSKYFTVFSKRENLSVARKSFFKDFASYIEVVGAIMNKARKFCVDFKYFFQGVRHGSN